MTRETKKSKKGETKRKENRKVQETKSKIEKKVKRKIERKPGKMGNTKNNTNTIKREDYFSHDNSLKYMGASQFKEFAKCEYEALARVKGECGELSSPSLLQGNLMDFLFENGCSNLSAFTNEHPEMISSRGATKGELKSEYQKTLSAFEFVSGDDRFMKFATGKQQKIFTGEIAGVPFKIMIDSLLPNMIVDRKFMKDMESQYDSEQGFRVPFWAYWGYDIQGAIYQEIYRQATGKKLPFALAVLTKETVPDKAVIVFEQEILDKALAVVKEKAPRFNAIKLGVIEPTKCGHCDWCKANKMIDEPIGASSFLDDGFNIEESEDE